ncbi:MAG: M23 family metallopeptidase [Acidobacteriota bacterium]
MSGEHHTVIFVPHARAKLRKWRVSTLQIRLVLSAIALLLLSSAFVTWAYLSNSVDRSEIVRLRSENDSLRSVNEQFEGSIRDLEEKLSGYEDRTLQLAIVAGLDPRSGDSGNGEAGIGGDLIPRGEVDPLTVRLSGLDDQLDLIESELNERTRWIAATPAIAPTNGILTSRFGQRRDPITGAPAFHGGIDISAAPGLPVRAAADGVVARAGRIGALGKAIYVAHGFGMTTRYGHLSDLEVSPGQEVKRGDVIGYVGNTGRATGYHLHYEVHVDGKAVDPVPYILDGV